MQEESSIRKVTFFSGSHLKMDNTAHPSVGNKNFCGKGSKRIKLLCYLSYNIFFVVPVGNCDNSY